MGYRAVKGFGIASVLFTLFTSYGYAEVVKNYNNCKVCPGNIAYGEVEAREILGSSAFTLIKEMKPLTRTIIKVDLQGALKHGSMSDPDTGYEIEISAFPKGVFIKSLLDGSYIQVVADQMNAKGTDLIENWRPEIYLQSKKVDEIDLQDPLEVAWEKMKESHIYGWIFGGQAKTRQLPLLGSKILESFQLVAQRLP